MDPTEAVKALTGMRVVVDYPGGFLVKSKLFAGIAAIGVCVTIAIGLASLVQLDVIGQKLSKLEKKVGA